MHADLDQTFSFPKVRLNARGDGVVVWDADQWYEGPLRRQVRIARFDGAARTFGAQIRVSPVDGDIRSDSEAAVDPNGNVVIVWHQGDPFNNARTAWANVFDAASGTTLGEVQISRALGGFAELVRVAVDGQGNAYAVYGYRNTIEGRLEVVRYDASARAWSAPVDVDPGVVGAERYEVVADAAGNATLVWSGRDQLDQTDNHVYAVRYDSQTGAWSPRVQLDVAENGTATLGKLVQSETGDVLALWTQGAPEASGVWAARLDAACARFQAAERVDPAPHGAEVGARSVAGAHAIAGSDVALLWADGADLRRSSYRAAEARWVHGSGTIQLTFDSGDFVSDAAGRGLFVYGGGSVSAVTYDPVTDSFAAPQVFAGDAAGSPHIAMDGAGRAVAVWTHGVMPRPNNYVAALEWGTWD